VKTVILVAAVAGFGAVAAALVIGNRVSEPKVVADPYEAGLRWDAEQKAARKVDCALSRGPCTSGTGDAALTLEVTPRPVRSMSDLVFLVSGPAAAAAGASGVIALNMPGMYMGKNEVQLAPDGAGHLSGKGVIVRCPSGHLTWSALVTARSAGGPAATATFTFDLTERASPYSPAPR
jgi:hypothetical protein